MVIKNKSTAVTTVASAEALAELRQGFPAEQGFQRIQLPRLGMYAQDQTEEIKNPKTGKKEIKIITEAGTFYVEKETEELDKDGKKVWEKTEIGTSIEGVIFFQRKQLKSYDEKTETFTNSAVYDEEDEVIPLWSNRAEVDRGTPAELKARPQYQVTKNGKIKSSLEDNRILYVLYEGEVYQMQLRGSSMYSWMSYARKVLPPAVLTSMTSEPQEKGDIQWNKMIFSSLRELNASEVKDIQERVNVAQEGVKEEKTFYASMNAASVAAKKDLEDFSK